MQIKLTKKAPEQDGYYLVKFQECSGLHLVSVKTVNGRKEIFADNCLSSAKPLYFHDFPEAWWSEAVEITF